MTRAKRILGVCSVTAIVAMACAYQSTYQLMENGQLVSSNVVNIKGQLMVPVRDLAKHFGYRVSVAGGVATLIKLNDDTGVGAAATLVPPTPLPGAVDPNLTPPLPLTLLPLSLHPSTRTAAPCPWWPSQERP